MAKHGFDLTEIDANHWKNLIADHGLVRSFDEEGWKWKAEGILIVAGNDPVSGKYARPNMRPDQIGYASYIGIEGESEIVESVVQFIKKHADFIKDESEGKRGFI